MKHCVGALSAINPAIVSYDFQSSQETASQIQLGQKKRDLSKGSVSVSADGGHLCLFM